MRVLHLNHEKTWRGGERQTLLTALEQRRQGLAATIACRRSSPLEDAARREGLPLVSLPVALPAALPALRQAASSCDVLHCHTGRGHSLGALATLGSRTPLIVSRRVDFVPSNSWFNRWKFRRTARVVCVSQCIAGIMKHWGVAPDRISVIYEAVPGDNYLPREECLKELGSRAGLQPGQRLIGNIAALVPHKDHATLLRAARIVAASRPEVRFVVIGAGELKGDLLALRRELDLEGAVHFTGAIPQAQRLLKAFDVFAMSSAMEGLGTIVLDAGWAGVPVAATAGGGLPEAVLNGRTGLVVPVGDAAALARALLRLLDEPALAPELARAARQRVEREFSVANMAQRYVEIYRALAKGANEP